jgi:hypothetical protein
MAATEVPSSRRRIRAGLAAVLIPMVLSGGVWVAVRGGLLGRPAPPPAAAGVPTATATRLGGILWLLLRPEPLHQPAAAGARAQIAGKQREQASQPAAGDLLVAERHPRQQRQLDGHAKPRR